MTVTSSAQPSHFHFPADLEIRRIISERIEDWKQGVGMVVGLVSPEGRRVIAYGHFGIGDPRPVDADTVFEIGSVTKIFTSLLLADMVHRNEMLLADPVAKHLPSEVMIPRRGGKEITLADLATHTSGLPGMPNNFAPADPGNPYADYSVEQLYQFLSNHQLMRDIGAQREYSNLGYGLLGQALSWRAATDYETLVRNRILAPLGMKSTAIILFPEMHARLAVGHNPVLEAVPNWDLPTFAGAGALRSTATDLLAFLEMALDIKQTPLAPAFAATLPIARSTGMSDGETGLGWLLMKSSEDEIIWHNGGTGGYVSFIGFLMKAKMGVVVLSNTSTFSIDDIGQHLLNPEIPLATLPRQRPVMVIDPKLYDRYVGRYRLTPDLIWTVTRAGDRLFAYAELHEKLEIFPEGERNFFCKAMDIQITFEADDKGRAVSLTLTHGGQQMQGLRISE
jgi:CubicO group peptidase (beta-lactamase class C family)